MIFVSLGTQKMQMNRLLIEIDALIADGLIKDDVFAQTGYSDYVPKHFRFAKFLSPEAFNENLKSCCLFITHGGVGSILGGLEFGKKIIAVPRLSKYREHVDDHQVQICEKYSKKGLLIFCPTHDGLMEKIKESETFVPKEHTKTSANKNSLVDFISYFIDNI